MCQLRQVFSICYFLLCGLFAIDVYCTTHWVVTDDGKIQAQMDSLFQLRRPYDFLALAQQEQRAVQVEELKQQLLKHKAHIDMHEDKDTHLEERIYRTDLDCLLAGKPLTEFDLAASTVVPLTDYPELRVEELLLSPLSDATQYEEPDCVAAFPAMPAFSMAALDHLQSMQERANLSGSPELRLTLLGIRESDEDTMQDGSDEDDGSNTRSDNDDDDTSDEVDRLSMYDDGLNSFHSTDSMRTMPSSHVDLDTYTDDDNPSYDSADDPAEWGDRVSRTLKGTGGSSMTQVWLLHHLAAQYWRVRGQPTEALECLRRALYLVPRQYRVVPLVSAGNVLHRSERAHEAALALHAALDHSRHSYAAHLTLGHVYASMALYNVSVVCYRNAGVVRPSASLPRKLRHAVLCHAHLEDALQRQHKSLQRTLSELKQYQQRHEEWLSLHQKLLLEQATPEMKLESRLEYEEQKIRESSDGRGQDCFQYQQDGHTFLSCNMRRDQLEHRPQATDLLLDLTMLLHSVQGEALRLSHLRSQPTHSTLQPVTELRLPLLSSDGGGDASLSSPHWGGWRGMSSLSAAQCVGVQPLPHWDQFPPVLLTPDLKGYNVKHLLTSGLDQPLDIPLPLPRHLPICPRLSPSPLPAMLARLRTTPTAGSALERQWSAAAQEKLSELGTEGDLHEAGHRIALAMHGHLAPPWVLYTLAAVYWRAVGNTWNGVECLRQLLGEEVGVLGEAVDGEEVVDVGSTFTEDDEIDVAAGGGVGETQHPDLALTSLASLVYVAGNIDDGLELARRAVEVAGDEPSSLFLLGNMLSAKGNLTGASECYSRVLALRPLHPHARIFLTALTCHAHHHKHPAHSRPSSTRLPVLGEGGASQEVTREDATEGTCEAAGLDCLSEEGDTGLSKEAVDDSESIYLDVEDDEDVQEGPTQDGDEDDFGLPFGSVLSTTDKNPRSPSLFTAVKSSSVLFPTVEEDSPDSTSRSVYTPLGVRDTLQPVDLRSGGDDNNLSEDNTNEYHQEQALHPGISSNSEVSVEDDPLPELLLRGGRYPVPPPVVSDSQLCEGYKGGLTLRHFTLRHFTSTWLSVSAKNIDVPVCSPVPASLLSMDHLSGVRHCHHLPRMPEAGLLEALHTLVDPPQSMEVLGHRLSEALQQHPSSSPQHWVVCTGAALYWRVEGNAGRAVDCLRAALQHAPRDMRDVPLTSLANVLHRSGLYNNALVAANAALEISPKFVVIHFTMANIYAAMDELDRAASYYESTLALQSTFEPARDRLQTIHCDKWWQDRD